MRKFILSLLVICITIASCNSLSDGRAGELVRLHYRQVNSDPGAGKWIVEEVQIGNIDRISGDTFLVSGVASGIYFDQGVQKSISGPAVHFSDSFHYKAFPVGKVWIAKSWRGLRTSIENKGQ
jgi:hypothetical protein